MRQQKLSLWPRKWAWLVGPISCNGYIKPRWYLTAAEPRALFGICPNKHIQSLNVNKQHKTFKRWMSSGYDLGAIHMTDNDAVDCNKSNPLSRPRTEAMPTCLQ